MQYPLTETIGNPDLFVGRHEEFERINEWLEFIPKRLSMSTVISFILFFFFYFIKKRIFTFFLLDTP